MQIDLLCQIITKINTFIFLFKPLYLLKHSFASSSSLVLLALSWGICVLPRLKLLESPALSPGICEHHSSCHILNYHLFLEFRGLYRIFSGPKKRGLTELLGLQPPFQLVLAGKCPILIWHLDCI